MRRYLLQGLWMVVVWVALWGSLTVANVLGGLVLAAVILMLFGKAGPRPVAALQPLAALRYAGTFLGWLVESTAKVAVQVLQPPERLRPAIVAVPLQGLSDAVVTLVGNSITLTPGTMTIEARSGEDGAVLYVHVLDLADLEEARRDIQYLEYLAIRAFGTPEARADAINPRATENGEVTAT